MIKPLYLTYSNNKEPYLSLTKRLGNQIKELKAGDFHYFCMKRAAKGMKFFAEIYALMYQHITQRIDSKPIIVLDADNELIKPIVDAFVNYKDFDIAAAYRNPRKNECGRQDYCSGLVVLNNQRPNIIRKFWFEWIYRIMEKDKCFDYFPKSLKEDGWAESWYIEQAVFNDMILPIDDQVKINQPYSYNGYRILPLDHRLYSAKPDTKEDVYVIHHKGGIAKGRE